MLMAMLSLSSASQPTCLTIKISRFIVSGRCKYGATRLATQSLGRSDFGKTGNNFIKGLYHSPRFKVLAASTLPVVQTVEEKLSAYLFRTDKGGNVKVVITKLKDGKYGINVEIPSLQLNGKYANELIMSWGVFRSDSSSLIPLQSIDSGIFETPFAVDSLNNFSAKLEFDASLAPFYVSFVLKCPVNGEKIEIKSHRKTSFCFPVGIKSGHPSPLGVSYSTDGSLNFALFSRNAKGVILCLFDDDNNSSEEPALEIDLDPYVNRSGDIWHASMDGVMNFVSYGYRVKHDGQEKSSIVLDPYSKVIGENFLVRICKEPTFDWSDDVSPSLPMEKLTVYRLNVADFTKDMSSKLPDEIRGSFSAITEKLHHFKDLGVNAILLEPIVSYDKRKGPYYPSHFFSPQNSYGPHLKQMVKRLHANGIEILLEVVFTHTCGNSSLAKIDKPTYYASDNTLNCAHPVVQNLILDSLKHWVINYHIDGFCFVNSSSMLSGFNGEHLSRPPLIEAIAFDPILSKTKIIADSFDPIRNSTKEIMFPHWKKWAEMNARFCSDVRNYLRGESLVSNLATRLCGSGDIFLNGRGPALSFNFVARAHGLSLVDLVSFTTATEFSWNCGEEGATKKKTVLETRLKQIRNFLFILFISLGVPVLNMGDECGQSSGGKISVKDRKPFNWKALKTGFAVQMIEFISFLGSLRVKRSDYFQRREFFKAENIDWYGPDLNTPNWEDPTSKFIAMNLKFDQNDESQLTSDMFAAFNSGDGPITATLPPPRLGMVWVRLVDTGLSYPGFFSMTGEPVVEKVPGSLSYQMTPHSCVLLEIRSLDG
ncbi:isoamylase 2, chloroplastic-like [Bidens hawaiensis]|uniref:isoamylase 2, chloroplastic-like n=1 Tax=Bidens hawaiensis TaxID=980011 RepID=UPI00404A16DB